MDILQEVNGKQVSANGKAHALHMLLFQHKTTRTVAEHF
jgi:hypothetical protein